MNAILTARFHEHGDRDVLRLESVPVPRPIADQVRIKVHGCALNWLGVGMIPTFADRSARFTSLPIQARYQHDQ